MRTGKLERMLGTWFGMTWLSRFDRVALNAAEPMAGALHTALSTRVFSFAAADPTANRRIASDFASLAQVDIVYPLFANLGFAKDGFAARRIAKEGVEVWIGLFNAIRSFGKVPMSIQKPWLRSFRAGTTMDAGCC